MGRLKGSKNKATKKEVKKLPLKAAVNKAIKKADVAETPEAASFEDQVKIILSHILQVFKASLLDAFRQYVISRMLAGQAATVDNFKSTFKHTTKVHGITDEVFLSVLSGHEIEYMASDLGRGILAKNNIPQIVKTPEAPKANAPIIEEEIIVTKPEVVKEEKNNASVFDSLDLI